MDTTTNKILNPLEWDEQWQIHSTCSSLQIQGIEKYGGGGGHSKLNDPGPHPWTTEEGMTVMGTVYRILNGILCSSSPMSASL
jgi:hypothetical protein